MKAEVFKQMFDNPPPKIGIREAKDIPRMPPARIPCSHEELEAHLQKYVKLMKQNGADDAQMIEQKTACFCYFSMVTRSQKLSKADFDHQNQSARILKFDKFFCW